MWSVTSAIVPTLANSPSWRGIEQDPLLVAHADGKRHIHGGEDHRVVQRDEQEGCHGVRLHFL